jgi:hypothetical protein
MGSVCIPTVVLDRLYLSVPIFFSKRGTRFHTGILYRVTIDVRQARGVPPVHAPGEETKTHFYVSRQ